VGYAFVLPRLAQGSVPTGVLQHSFHTVVLCAEELQDVPVVGAEVIHAPLDDAKPTPRELHTAYSAARAVASRWRQGRYILVTCAMGRNRSGLVTGLALMMLGMTNQQAIRMIRAARPRALSNLDFVAVLANFQSQRRRAA
jgi:protein-tyrosine phosphatase